MGRLNIQQAEGDGRRQQEDERHKEGKDEIAAGCTFNIMIKFRLTRVTSCWFISRVMDVKRRVQYNSDLLPIKLKRGDRAMP